jgi:aminopeptidase N
VLRTHRVAIGLYDLDGDRLVRRDRIELDVSGARTPVPVLLGQRAPDVLLLNDDDLTYAKLRLDDRSMATVVEHITGFDSALPRALCWAAAWDMLRDAELAARDYTVLACAGLPTEGDINLVTATIRQLSTAIPLYGDPAWHPTGWELLADTARSCLAGTAPGSGFQLAWARAFLTAARSDADLTVLRNWINGVDVPAGLTIDTDLRWAVLNALVALGQSAPGEIEAELDRDRTASGERAAAQAHALVPTAASKAETWRRLTGEDVVPNSINRALLLGFWHSAQLELTAPYVTKFFDVVDEIWATRDSEPAQEFLLYGYPTYYVNDAAIAAADTWLAGEGHPDPLRRLVAEGRDSVVRAYRARAKDAAASG